MRFFKEKKTGPTTPSDPQLASLHDLGTGESFTRDTSYVGEQNEVRNMVAATKDGQTHWPGFWYEILQGAWDYNDWQTGPPEIRIFRHGESEPVSLYQFIADRRQGKNHTIDQVQVINHIRNGEGLRPANIALTEHDEHSNRPTLGDHGRGLKIATTAACAGGLAKKVTFESWVPEIGSWYGEADLAPDPIDPKVSPNLQIRYKRDQHLALNLTTITVHEPSRDTLEALSNLPEWFLPTNPKYQYQRMGSPDPDINPNLFTVHSNPKLATGSHTSSFDTFDLMIWSSKKNEQKNGIEPPRVEILPRDILPNLPPTIDFVFVDGLRVKVPGAKFSQVFSFWGFKNYSNGHNPHRSNDSLRLEGDCSDLLTETLIRCNNPQVFAEILEASMSENPPQESYIGSYQFTEGLKEHPDARQALSTAWKQTLEHINAPPDSHITTSKEAHARAQREKIPTVLVNSFALVNGITRNTEVTTVDSVFEKHDADERRQHAADVLRLEEEKRQLARQEAERLQQYIRQRELDIQQALEEDRRTRGVKTEAKSTGEILKIRPENEADSAEIAKLHLIHLLGLNQGTIDQSKSPENFTLNMEAGDFDHLPNNIDDLGPVSPFIKNFLAAYGNTNNLEIRVVINGQGTYFKLSRSVLPDDYGNFTITVQKGITDMNNSSLLQIIISPKEAYGSRALDPFRQNITEAINPLMKNGSVNRDLYLQSEYFDQYPPAAALIRTRRQLEEAKNQTEAAIESLNLIRIKAGLPPIANPFNIPNTNSDPNNNKSGLLPNPQDTAPKPNHPDRTFEDRRNTIDDVPIIETVLYLNHPDSIPSLSTTGKKHRREIILDERSAAERLRQRAADRLQERLHRRVSPDWTLASGEFTKIRGYLIDHFNPAYSEISTADYAILPPLPYMERNGLVRLRYNKAIEPSLNTLPCPPGCRPVAFYHPKEHSQIIISGNEERNVFAFSNQNEIPAGLTIYYEKSDRVDTSRPDNSERGVVADFDGLNQYWKDLITTINETPDLTDKNKVDILLQAWTKAFQYNDSQETFDLYEESRPIPKTFATEIINHAIGDCGYCHRGFHGLLSLVGIPSREVACYLHDGFGNYSRSGNYHGINQPYINGHWVYVEPQSGYLEPGYEMEQIPETHRATFKPLLAAIPEAKSKSPRFINGLPEILPNTMPPINGLADDLIDAVSQILPITIPKPRDIIGAFTSQIDMYGRKRFLRDSLKAFVASGSVFGIITLIGPKVSKFITSPIRAAEPIISNPSISLEPVSSASPTILEPIISNPAVQEIARHLSNVPPEYIVAGLLIGTTAFTAGIYVERRRQKKKKANLPLLKPTAENYNFNNE